MLSLSPVTIAGTEHLDPFDRLFIGPGLMKPRYISCAKRKCGTSMRLTDRRYFGRGMGANVETMDVDHHDPC
jgi:hypothetical protein